MRRRPILLPLLTLTAAGLLLPAAPAQADPGPVQRAAADSAGERSAVLRYWTSWRMERAQPLETRASRDGTMLTGPAGRSAGRTTGTGLATEVTTGTGTRIATRGTAHRVPPTAPLTRRVRTAALAPNSPGEPWTGGGAITRTTGRVFFTTQGRNASCSGSAVTSANRSVVLTAGHCVKLGGAFHTNWVFVPGYEDGRRPFGTWVATRLLTTRQWNASEDINHDVAAAVVAPLEGRALTDVVGGQGVAFSQPRRQQMYAFGYPAAAPYDGSRLIYCSGRAFDDFLLTRDQGLNCDMTGGSSGGPWLLDFDESTGLGTQNSVNSFKYNFAPDLMFGPYFGAEAQAVYQAAQGIGAP